MPIPSLMVQKGRCKRWNAEPRNWKCESNQWRFDTVIRARGDDDFDRKRGVEVNIWESLNPRKSLGFIECTNVEEMVY